MIAAAALAVGTVISTCSWDRPGVDPFMGDVVTAVDRYTDIPPRVRQTLKGRMFARQYDEVAEITGSEIRGEFLYDNLRDMHFGEGRICRKVTRNWDPRTVERGLVYCEEGHCLIVPTVCRNVSRITRVSRALRSDELPEIRIEIPGGSGRSGQILPFGGDDPTARTFAPLETDERHPPVPPLPPMRGGFTEPIPEPSTWALFVVGILMLLIAVKKGWEK